MVDPFCDYDVLAAAECTRIKDICPRSDDDYNAEILQKLKNNDADFHYLTVDLQNVPHMEIAFVSKGTNLGFLGYFLGQNEVLQKLSINGLVDRDQRDRQHETRSCRKQRQNVEALFKGISRNKSIEILCLQCDLLGGEIIRLMEPFLKNNHNLTTLRLDGDWLEFGHKEARQLSLALGGCSNKSLTTLEIVRTMLDDEGCAEIALGLSVHSQLTSLLLCGNDIGTMGCIALGTLLKHTTRKLCTLDLSGNAVDDDGLEALLNGLMDNKEFKSLGLSYNVSISITGLRALSLLVSSKNNNLTVLWLDGNFIDDEAAFMFAGALKNNRTLQDLILNAGDSTMTSSGWSAFSRLLCDTSSINATQNSNHTLQHLAGEDNYVPSDDIILSFVYNNLNTYDAKDAAMLKILRHHSEIDMTPFFEWDIKLLPNVMFWLDSAEILAQSCLGYNEEFPIESIHSIQSRKLSALYQFVQEMPVLV